MRHHPVGGILVRADDGLDVLAVSLRVVDRGDQSRVIDGNAIQVTLALASHQQREGLLQRLAAVRRSRQFDLDSLFHDVRSRNHEDDQEHQRDVDERRDVDAGDSLVVVVDRAAGQGQPPFAARATYKPAAMELPRALERPTTRFKSRWKMLNASTAGMATSKPTAVATKASEMPAMTKPAVEELPTLLAVARSAKARMMPKTVPNKPMNGALLPSVPSTKSHCSYSMRRRSMVA